MEHANCAVLNSVRDIEWSQNHDDNDDHRQEDFDDRDDDVDLTDVSIGACIESNCLSPEPPQFNLCHRPPAPHALMMTQVNTRLNCMMMKSMQSSQKDDDENEGEHKLNANQSQNNSPTYRVIFLTGSAPKSSKC